jgi:hypothetical protein
LFSDSSINPDTVQAYLETEYFVRGEHDFVLRVGQFNKSLQSEHRCQGSDCSAFITAYNPYSNIVAEADNTKLHKALTDELKRRSLTFADGVGQHPSNRWPGEPSYLIFGLSLEASKTLGARFEQNAILWCGADCIPQLILLR